MLKRFSVVILFGIGFAYVEAAVVVYLRHIFYPDGFSFPLTAFDDNPATKYLFLTEIAREAATLLIILSSSQLIGRNRGERWAAFLTIFAVWDIFYYVWLKVILNWPGSIMDWDILFLIPVTWASPVAAPIIISLTMLLFAGIILYQSSRSRSIRVTKSDQFGFVCATAVIVLSFCIAGMHIESPDYRAYFDWPLFALGEISAVAIFYKCLLRTCK